MLYSLLKRCASIFFNSLNVLLAGNLPPFGCASVIVEEQDRYLVVELREGTIVFPGGFMRWQEHPKQTARREGKEETGLDLQIGNLIDYYSFKSDGFDRMSTVNLVYGGKVVGGELHSSAEGRPYWLEEQALREKMSQRYSCILDDYLRYRAEHSGSEHQQEAPML